VTSTELRSMHELVLAAAKELNDRGLVEGSSGNLSARIDERHVCMTPSSIPYDDMVVDDLVVVDVEGNVVEGDKGPTSEKALHLACYRRYPEVGGVIHSHAVYATMFAVAREPIPAAIEEVAVYIGGDVPVAEYTMTGTDELGEEVASHLGDRAAVLVANHGMVTVGSTLGKALHAARLVERTAQIVFGARVLGRVHDVPAEVNENFADVYRLMRSP
jgi:L-fuculose-phosphate aldolase